MSDANTEKLPQPIASLKEKAKRVDSERLGSLKLLAPLLNIVFAHLNHMQIDYDEQLAESFVVKTEDQGEKEFSRRLFTSPNTSKSAATFIETGPARLREFGISITIGGEFNIVTDLPRLIKAVEQAHNQQIKEYGGDNPMLFINTSKQLADYWSFMSERLQEFTTAQTEQLYAIEHQAISSYQQKEYKEEKNSAGAKKKVKRYMHGPLNLSDTLKAYVELCQLISKGFSTVKPDENVNNLSDLAHEVDASAVFSRAWQKTETSLQTTMDVLVKRSKGENKNPNRQLYPQQLYDLLYKALDIIGGRAQEQIIAELNTQARDVFFKHCSKELYRKTGLDELMERYKQDDSNDSASVVEKHTDYGDLSQLIKFIRQEFPTNQEKLNQIKQDLQRAKQTLKNKKAEGGNVQQETADLVDLQEQLANKLCAIVYSEKFFAYKNDNYSFSSAIEESFANCMISAELLSQLWSEYAGEAGFGATTNNHYFFVTQLANKKYISLNSKPRDFNPQRENYYEFGAHEQLYQAAMCNWKGFEMKGDVNKHQLAEVLFKEAIRLAPNNPDFKTNLANLLAKYPKRHAEAEVLYREAIRLAPNDPDFKFNLANLLKKYPSRHAEAEVLYREAIRLAPNNPDFKFNLANLLAEYPERHAEAEVLYREAIRLAPNNPWLVTGLANFYHNFVNHLNKEQSKKLALENYQKALKIMEENPDAKNWLNQEDIKNRIERLS